MQSDDRKEFDAMMDQLCVGLGAVSYDVRKEAYWIGLQKMSLIQFGRVVEFCISEQGPEKVPSVPAVWKLWRDINAKARAQAAPPAAPRVDDSPGLRRINGMFLQFVKRRRLSGNFKGDIDVAARRRACLDLAAWLDRAFVEDLVPDAAELQTMFDKAMAAIPDAPDAPAGGENGVFPYDGGAGRSIAAPGPSAEVF